MQIKVESKNNTDIVILSGEVDLYNSPQVRKKLTELINHKNPHIIVDLSGVTYMDSSGLATLVEAMQKIAKNNGKFILVGIKGAVKNMFEIARLNEVFSIYENITTALAS